MREVLYGRNAVYESLHAGRRTFHKLLLAEGVRKTDVIERIVSLAGQRGVPVVSTKRQNLDQLGKVNHQGVALETESYPYHALEDLLALARSRDEPPFLLLLDLLHDPQNVGSLVRTAEAVGVHGVIIQRRRAVGITPAVVRSSAGAVEHLLVAQVTNLAKTVEALKAQDVWVAGLEGVPGAHLYCQFDLQGALALVVGNEGKGLRRLVRERCDFLLALPMLGQIPSLNAAVAGSVVLYEAWRQRQGEET